MKRQHLIPILSLAAYCTVSAQTNNALANTGTSSLKVLAPPQYKVYTDSKREPKGSITTWSATNSGDFVVFSLHNNLSGSNWVVNLRFSDGQVSQANTPSKREPKGSHNLYFDSLGNTNGYNPNIDFYLHNSVSGSNWITSNARYKFITLPYILRDVNSGITYEVEADGRHVSATDGDGALLWYRDPFSDAHLQYYRTDTPIIVAFEFYTRSGSEDWSYKERMLHNKGIKKIINILFNSSQCGFMDPATGDFFFTGQF